MKKILYLLCLIMAIFATGCTNEEKDLFDDSSANRADAAIKASIEALVSAKNGWLMEYFPSPTQEFGGYNILVSFDSDGSVKVSSDIAGPTDVKSSLFSVKQSAGIMLSFDTANEIFHFFSFPNGPGNGPGRGLEGDYDFLFLETSAERIVLQGKKTGSITVLTPMKDKWEEYLTAVIAADNEMALSKQKLVIGEDKMRITTSLRTLSFRYEEDGSWKSQRASYIQTKTGYKFYEPITIKGNVISGFTFDAKDQSFTAFENPEIKMMILPPTANEWFVDNDWYIAYSALGKFAQSYFDIVKENYYKVEDDNLEYAYMGSTLYKEFGFTFKSSIYFGFLGMTYELIGEDNVTLIHNNKTKRNGEWYIKNAGFINLLEPFGYNSERIFSVTVDNMEKPTYVVLTENKNPDNKIKLFGMEVLDLYNK